MFGNRSYTIGLDFHTHCNPTYVHRVLQKQCDPVDNFLDSKEQTSYTFRDNLGQQYPQYQKQCVIDSL